METSHGMLAAGRALVSTQEKKWRQHSAHGIIAAGRVIVPTQEKKLDGDPSSNMWSCLAHI